ncbi:hypothetical protein Tco_0754870 [Tanacetum coccineum]
MSDSDESRAPPSPDHVPGPEEPGHAPPSPDYVPGPEHDDDEIVAEDHPNLRMLTYCTSHQIRCRILILSYSEEDGDDDPEEDPIALSFDDEMDVEIDEEEQPSSCPTPVVCVTSYCQTIGQKRLSHLILMNYLQYLPPPATPQSSMVFITTPDSFPQQVRTDPERSLDIGLHLHGMRFVETITGAPLEIDVLMHIHVSSWRPKQGFREHVEDETMAARILASWRGYNLNAHTVHAQWRDRRFTIRRTEGGRERCQNCDETEPAMMRKNIRLRAADRTRRSRLIQTLPCCTTSTEKTIPHQGTSHHTAGQVTALQGQVMTLQGQVTVLQDSKGPTWKSLHSHATRDTGSSSLD